MSSVAPAIPSDNPAITRFIALAGLVAVFLDHPTLSALDFASRALQAAWGVSGRLPEADQDGATRVLWEGERGLAQARRSLLILEPTRGLTAAPPSALTTAEAMAEAASGFLACGLASEARAALGLAWPALAWACRASESPPRAATVARALRDVEEALEEIAGLDLEAA